MEYQVCVLICVSDCPSVFMVTIIDFSICVFLRRHTLNQLHYSKGKVHLKIQFYSHHVIQNKTCYISIRHKEYLQSFYIRVQAPSKTKTQHIGGQYFYLLCIMYYNGIHNKCYNALYLFIIVNKVKIIIFADFFLYLK